MFYVRESAYVLCVCACVLGVCGCAWLLHARLNAVKRHKPPLLLECVIATAARLPMWFFRIGKFV